MITRPRSRGAGLAAVIGLLGACAVLIAGADAPGRTAPRPSSPAVRPRRLTQADAPADRAGLQLMRESAAACQRVPFHGVQLTDWFGPAGAAAAVVQVWHQAGRAVVARFAGASAVVLPVSPEIMTITPALLTLMQRNYVMTYAGDGAADGRPAQIIEVRRPGGGLAARYWLDAATRLPLRRELFDRSARLFSEDAFIQLRPGAGAVPAAGARPWTGRLTAAGRAALRAGGWPVPRSMAGGLVLFTATQSGQGPGRVVELSYSDGLSVVSEFLQRGQLPARMPGWREITDHGREVYAIDADGQSLAWSAGGYVTTVISDAPSGTVDPAGQPVPAPPGFWDRIGRGLHRIGSWADPLR